MSNPKRKHAAKPRKCVCGHAKSTHCMVPGKPYPDGCGWVGKGPQNTGWQCLCDLYRRARVGKGRTK